MKDEKEKLLKKKKPRLGEQVGQGRAGRAGRGGADSVHARALQIISYADVDGNKINQQQNALTIVVMLVNEFTPYFFHRVDEEKIKRVPVKLMLKRPCGQFFRLQQSPAFPKSMALAPMVEANLKSLPANKLYSTSTTYVGLYLYLLPTHAYRPTWAKKRWDMGRLFGPSQRTPQHRSPPKGFLLPSLCFHHSLFIAPFVRVRPSLRTKAIAPSFIHFFPPKSIFSDIHIAM